MACTWASHVKSPSWLQVNEWCSSSCVCWTFHCEMYLYLDGRLVLGQLCTWLTSIRTSVVWSWSARCEVSDKWPVTSWASAHRSYWSKGSWMNGKLVMCIVPPSLCMVGKIVWYLWVIVWHWVSCVQAPLCSSSVTLCNTIRCMCDVTFWKH